MKVNKPLLIRLFRSLFSLFIIPFACVKVCHYTFERIETRNLTFYLEEADVYIEINDPTKRGVLDISIYKSQEDKENNLIDSLQVNYRGNYIHNRLLFNLEEPDTIYINQDYSENFIDIDIIKETVHSFKYINYKDESYFYKEGNDYFFKSPNIEIGLSPEYSYLWVDTLYGCSNRSIYPIDIKRNFDWKGMFYE